MMSAGCSKQCEETLLRDAASDMRQVVSVLEPDAVSHDAEWAVGVAL